MGASASVPEDGSASALLAELAKDGRIPARSRGRLQHSAEQFLQDAVAEWHPSTLRVTVHRAAGLADEDRRSLSDPYVCAYLRGAPSVFACTERVRNSLHPWWGGADGSGAALSLPGADGRASLVLQVFDCDSRSPDPRGARDTLLGSVVVPLAQPEGSWGQQVTIDIARHRDQAASEGEVADEANEADRGTLTFAFSRNVPWPADKDDAKVRLDEYMEMLPSAAAAAARKSDSESDSGAGAGEGAKAGEGATRDIAQECATVMQVLRTVLKEREDATASDVDVHVDDLLLEKAGFKSLLHRMHHAVADGSFEALMADLCALSANPSHKSSTNPVPSPGTSQETSQEPSQEPSQETSQETSQATQPGSTEPLQQQHITQEESPQQPLPAPGPGPAPAPAQDAPQRQRVVLRCEMRRMGEESQMRFIRAVGKLMESGTPEVPGSSEWMRIAGYHGWPGGSDAVKGYCVHRSEAFPGWHRGYLLEMERALQRADEELGNDGDIGVPYWDFAQYEVNGEVAPRLIREHFGKGFRFPANFFPDDEGFSNKSVDKFKQRVFDGVRGDAALLRRLRNGKVRESSARCLDVFKNAEHWKHASKESKASSAASLEGPHDSVHTACGFPMSTTKYAAFHPLFWLLHCNADRLYETYLETEGREECLREMQHHQRIRGEQGKKDLFGAPLAPFSTRLAATGDGGDDVGVGVGVGGEGELLTLAHTVGEVSSMGYVYDELPPLPKQQLRELPTFALFSRVDVVTKLVGLDGDTKSFDLHVFASRSASADVDALRAKLDAAGTATTVAGTASATAAASATAETPDFAEWAGQQPEYAGACALFGGKGAECGNCRENSLVSASVDLNDVIARLGADVTRYDVALTCVCEDEQGVVCLLSQAQERFGAGVQIPAPVVAGPMFEAREPSLGLEVTADIAGQPAGTQGRGAALQLQAVLARQGFYAGAADGSIGAVTDAAVKRFQSFAGLAEDGIVGPQTKAVLSAPRYDGLHDAEPATEAAAAGATTTGTARAAPAYAAGAEVKYWIGTAPGYLPRAAVERELGEAAQAWSALGVVALAETAQREEADFTMTWADHGEDEDSEMLASFDGPGGELARADAAGITFDVSERWACNAEDATRRSFRLKAVALHELGHVLGLAHAPRGIMAPYYVPTRLALTKADKDQLRLHGTKKKTGTKTETKTKTAL